MSWILFCEAQADFATASELIDRALHDRAPTWVGDLLEHTPEGARSWTCDGTEPWWDLHRLSAYAAELGIRVPQGHFDGKPGRAGAAMARNVFAIIRHLSRRERIDGLVLLWDGDNADAARATGLGQARDLSGWDFAKVLALAIRSREAWVLAGFEPENERERESHAELKKKLGYCPLEQAHRLDSKSASKNVVDALTAGNWQREERCWKEAPLDRLRARGDKSGLARFLADVESELLPLIGGAASS